jgi:glycine hydroxymethyltransferase
MHVIAGKAVAFAEALKPEFKAYAKQVVANAKALAEALASGGVKLVSGGTDNHLMLVDVTPLGIGGKLAEETLDRCGITCNKNMIPYDERKPMDPSGIRDGGGDDPPRGGGARRAVPCAGGSTGGSGHGVSRPRQPDVLSAREHVSGGRGDLPRPALPLNFRSFVVRRTGFPGERPESG